MSVFLRLEPPWCQPSPSFYMVLLDLISSEMKRIEILNLYRVLGKIRTAGITSSDIKGALISAHLKLFKYAKENDDFVAGLSSRFSPDERDMANETYDKFLNETVDIELDKMDSELFAKEIAKTDTDIYLYELNTLEPLFK